MAIALQIFTKLIFIRDTAEDRFRLHDSDNPNGNETIFNEASNNLFFMQIKKTKKSDTRSFRT